MTDYYDSWSANKKNRNPARSRARIFSGNNNNHNNNNRLWVQHQQSSSVSTSANSTATTTTSTSPRSGQPLTPALLSPVLPYYSSDISKSSRTSTAPDNKDYPVGNKQRPTSVWRFPKALFDSYETDFDDIDEGDDDDDDDGEDDDNEDDIKDKQRRYPSGTQNHIHPKSPTIMGSAAKPGLHTPSKRFMHWKGHRPRPKPIETSQFERGIDIEQVDTHRDPFSPSLTSSHSMSRSSPSLSATVPPIDDPHSTSTFNARWFPQSILRSANTADTQTSVHRMEGRRARPWSQVIWESPVMGGGSLLQQQQQKEARRPRGFEHIIAGSANSPHGYPALPKDLFAQQERPERERTNSKSVRINIEGDRVGTGLASDPLPDHNSSVGHQLLSTHSRREFSNGRKHMKRLSIGPGFYASIEPVSLSAATPSTPRNKRNLIKLPARPQSVLIPPSSYSHHGMKGGGLNQGQGPITEATKRRRHQSQQLDMIKGASGTVAVPWQQPESPTIQDNPKTLRITGSPLATGLNPKTSALRKDDPADISTVTHPVTTGSEPELGFPQCPGLQSPQEPVQTQAWKNPRTHSSTLRHSPTHQKLSQSPPSHHRTRPSPAQVRSAAVTPSRFLPTLPEGRPSGILGRASFFALPPSPKERATGVDTMSFQSISSGNSFPHSSPVIDTTHSHSPQQHSYQHSPLPARKSLPTNSTPSRSRRTLTASLKTVTPFASHSHGQLSKNNHSSDCSEQRISDGSNTNSSSSTSHHCNAIQASGHRSSILFNAARLPSWKRTSSSFFPFSLVSYESGGLLGEIRNTSTTVCTNAPSPVVAPGTPLPPGVIVSTGIPSPPPVPSPTCAKVGGGGGGSPNYDSQGPLRPFVRFDSTESCSSKHSTTGSEPSETFSHDSVTRLCQNCGCRSSLDGTESVEEGERCWCSSSSSGSGSEEQETDKSSSSSDGSESPEEKEGFATIMDNSIVIQKSHVAVYEINPRWGSRLTMFLVAVGGILCSVSGGLCAEHHCRDLQLCQDNYQGHGDWCGPSGEEGAPYMLTVGMSMWLFGLYALVYLRSPISRLVGYSEIDQFLG